MTNITNYYRHKDVVAAVKEVLGIPQEESLQQTLSSFSSIDAPDYATSPSRAKRRPSAHTSPGTTLIQEFSCLEHELARLYKADTAGFTRFIAKVERVLAGKPDALALVRALVA